MKGGRQVIDTLSDDATFVKLHPLHNLANCYVIA